MGDKLFHCMFCNKESTNEVYLFPSKNQIGCKVNLCTECQEKLIKDGERKGDAYGKL